MKTIKDAYEALNGDLNNTFMPNASSNDRFLFFRAGAGDIGYILDTDIDDEGGKYQYICTVEEFNNYKPEKTVHDAVMEFKGERLWLDNDIYMFGGDAVCTNPEFIAHVDLLASNFGMATQSYLDYKFEWDSMARLGDVLTGTFDFSKPIYTQAMLEAGECPKVGAKFIVIGSEGDSRIADFNNLEVEVIGLSITKIHNQVITFAHKSRGIGCGVFNGSWIKPLTPPITLIAKSLYLFTVGKRVDMVGEAYFTAIDEEPMITNIRTNTSYSQTCCTNIKPLTVEGKR